MIIIIIIINYYYYNYNNYYYCLPIHGFIIAQQAENNNGEFTIRQVARVSG